MAKTPDVLLTAIGVASAFWMTACSGESDRPVVATSLPRTNPIATLVPTPTYTADQAGKRRAGQELEKMDLSSFRGILLEPYSPIVFGDGDIVFVSFSQSKQVILDPNGLGYWVNRCGVNGLVNYKLTVAIQDMNSGGSTLAMAQSRDEGQVSVGISRLPQTIESGFDYGAIVAPENRARAVDNAFQVAFNLFLAQGICGVAKGSEVVRNDGGVKMANDEGNKKADEIGKLEEDFITGKLPLVAVVRSSVIFQ